MKKFLLVTLVSFAFFSSCTVDDEVSTTQLNNSAELENQPIKDKTKD